MKRLALLALLAAMSCSAAAAAEAADWYVDAATGEDAQSGSDPGRAWRTLGAVVDSINGGTVRAGDTVYFGPGTYGAVAPEYEDIRTGGKPGAPITLAGCAGIPKPTLLGWLVLTGDHLIVSGFAFDGPTGAYRSRDGRLAEQAPLEIQGDHVTLVDSEVEGSWSGGGVLLGAEADPAVDFTISRSWIHDNGRFADPDEANFHHGLYVQSGSGSISGNLIGDNYGYGVHLYPSPSNVTVKDNLIAGHGLAGVIVAGQRGARLPAGNVIVDNLMVDNNHAVNALDPVGRGNAAVRNVSWNNSRPAFFDLEHRLTLAGNTNRDPRLTVPERARAGNELPSPFGGSLALSAFEGGGCRY